MNSIRVAIQRVALMAVLMNIAVFAPSVGASSDGPVGKVVAIRNAVIALKDSVPRSLKLKDPIFLNDIIKTQNGRIQLMFEDNTLITLGRKTEMQITTYLWKPGDASSAMTTTVKEGSFRIMGGAITRVAPRNFKTQAPSGTIGIRGSMYAGLVKGQYLSVLFQGGKGIYVSNERGTVDISTPGFGTTIKGSGEAPTKPKKLTDSDLVEFEDSLAADVSDTDADDDEGTTSPVAASDTTDDEAAAVPSTGAAASADETGPKASDPTPAEASNTRAAIITEIVTDSSQSTTAQNSASDAAQNSATDDTQTSVSEEEKKVIALLRELGFTGERATSVPQTGISVYQGKLKGADGDTPVDEKVRIVINWENQRVAVYATPPDDDAPSNGPGENFDDYGGGAFGQVSSTGEIYNVHVLGPSGPDDDPDGNNAFFEPQAISGSETFGQVYGKQQEAVGLTAEGFDVEIRDQTKQQFWSDTLAAILDQTVDVTTSGPVTWNGFFVGVAEDMSRPDANRRIFVNNDPLDFELAIDKGKGTFSGTLSGVDFADASNQLKGLTIGGGADSSVFISKKHMSAFIYSDNGISTAAGTGGLKEFGNFMITAKDAFLSDHTTWGYWEAAYVEPGTGKDYHIHVPGAMWVAGKQTTAGKVDDLIATSFVGRYTGKAEGVRFDDRNQMTHLSNGATDLTIEFNSGSSTPVRGKISFDQIVFDVTSGLGDVTNQGFKGAITGAGTTSVNGAFFGPDGNSIGGNFSANRSDGNQYHGVFAGDRP